MKTLQNNFTTPEQSKRLLELGLPADSADCYYGLYKDLNVRRLSQLESNFFYRGDGICDTFLPCWSVGRLREIFCICSGVNGGREYPFCNSQVAWWITEFEFKKEFIDFSKLEK